MERTTRTVAAVVMPVLFAAWVILFLLPTRTESLWAWTIPIRMSAITMGGGYLGGVWFFSRVVRYRDGHEVAGGLLAATVFTTLLAITTVLHWSVFNHDHVSFWAWAFLYFASPPLLVVLFRANRAAAQSGVGGPVMSDRVRRLLGGIGLAQLAGALVAFVRPEWFLTHGAWSLTPATTRSLSSFVAFTGALLAWPLIDARWTAVRAGIEAVTIGLVTTGVGAIVARNDFTGPSYARVGYVVGLVGMLALALWVQWTYGRGERTRRTSGL